MYEQYIPAPAPSKTEFNLFNSEMTKVIIGNTSTDNVATGEYVSLKKSIISGLSDGIYKSKSNIASGTPFVSSNLEAVTGGAVNALNDDLDALNSKLTQQLTSTGLTASKCTIVSGGYAKIGNLVIVQIRVSNSSEAENRIITGFPAYNSISQNCVEMTASDYITSDRVRTNIEPNGTMTIYSTNTNGEFITGCYLCTA